MTYDLEIPVFVPSRIAVKRRGEKTPAQKAMIACHSRTRQAARRLRTPAWADRNAILAVYMQAQILSEKTGVPHQVDHIYPLQGRLVSGLHVHQNLRVLTAAQNRQKHNLSPDPLDETKTVRHERLAAEFRRRIKRF